VLDVGSNTVHLLIVDAHRGGHPTPMASEKTALRLAESLDHSGRLSRAGSDALVRAVQNARTAAAAAGCRDLLAFATSALRDAPNSAAVLARVLAETGVALQVLPGDDEARYTFLAVRRWFGWSAGQLLVVMGVYVLVGGVIRSVVQPNMQQLMTDVQEGTLDYVLTKPADGQLLVSVRRVEIWQAVDVFVGAGLIAVATDRRRGCRSRWVGGSA